MPKYRSDLITGNRLPQSTLDAMQEFIGVGAWGLRLVTVAASTTAIQLDTTEQTAAGVGGLWRYNAAAATVSATHPGGAAGIYPVFIVASANVISGSDVDTTDYTFGLQIKGIGGTPTGTYGGRTITQYRQIGTVVWDGSKITQIVQSVPAPPTKALWAKGTHAARPAATVDFTGWTYYETDTLKEFWSDGTSWFQRAGISSGPPSGWGTPTAGPYQGSARRTVLTAASTPGNVLDVLATLIVDLETAGVLTT